MPGTVSRGCRGATPQRAGGIYTCHMAIMDRGRERKLIERAKTGDGEAIEQLIRAHQEALYAFMLRMSGRPHVAEDITQEAFVRVLRNIDRFDTRFRFSTWLFTIAKRLYINAMQKQKPHFDTEILSGRPARERPEGGPPKRSATGELRGYVRDMLDEALDCLNPQQREIILLFHQQDWPINRIADHLDMPEGTVKSHLHRARRRMKKWIVADERHNARAQEVWA